MPPSAAPARNPITTKMGLVPSWPSIQCPPRAPASVVTRRTKPISEYSRWYLAQPRGQSSREPYGLGLGVRDGPGDGLGEIPALGDGLGEGLELGEGLTDGAIAGLGVAVAWFVGFGVGFGAGVAGR